MKKIKFSVFVVLIAMILITGCGKNYDNIKENLNGHTYYYNGGTINSLSGMIFEDGKVTIKSIYFDGNGEHDREEEQYNYTVDEENIIISDSDKTTITYKNDNDNIVLGDGKTYFREDEVKEGLKGYWKLKDTDYILGRITKSEHNIFIDEDKITYENATLAYNSNSEYYYYGPYTGEYKLKFGGFDTTMEERGNRLYFTILDNKVTLLYYNHACTSSDGLPGKDGYSF